MQYSLDEEFFDNTVFVIASPQEAEGMAILAKGHIVKYCIIVNYIDYTSSVQQEIIRRVIKTTKIQNLFSINLYLPRIQLNKGNRFECWKQMQFDRHAINTFDKKFFDGKLFCKKMNFVVSSLSPFISLSKYEKRYIYIMEHAPADSVHRIEDKLFQTEHVEKSSSSFQWWKNGWKYLKHMDSIFFNLMIKILYPYFFSLYKIEQGFTWVEKVDDSYMFIDPREYPLEVEFSPFKDELNNVKKTLLLVTTAPQAFKDDPIDLAEQGQQIDYPNMYLQIANKSIKKEEFVVFKLHPFLAETMGNEDLEAFANSIMILLRKHGYINVVNFESFFLDTYEAKMPVEIFLKALNINKIVGDFSSTMEIVQDWGDIEIFSDLRFMKIFEGNRERRMRILGGKYHVVN